MKKKDLLKYIDDELLDKLFGFCYARTGDSYEAEELCSDIVFALLKNANSEGEVENVYPFIWRVARNVYADFSDKRRRLSEIYYPEGSDGGIEQISENDYDDDSSELLSSVYRRIAFLTKAYRDIMVMFYLDGLSIAEIARAQQISETAVRQRLFAARKKLRNEVDEMIEKSNKPLALEKIDYVIWGTGDPAWGDPRGTCVRMLSKHIIWLCHKKAMSATEIAEILNVPTVYIEEELELLANGVNGEYGMLRRFENGKYGINFVLYDKDSIEMAHMLYSEQVPKICDIIVEYIEKHREEYLSFPYLNKKVDMNLILWQQVFSMSDAFKANVEKILENKYFSGVSAIERKFSLYGYVDNGKYYGGGWDYVEAQNVCGFSQVLLDNIYITRIQKHFNCGLNVSRNTPIQLALRAIDGLPISSLTEKEREHAAKAIDCGYLYKEGEKLFTKILVYSVKDGERLFEITKGLYRGFFEEKAEIVADKIAKIIRKTLPEYLYGEWKYANNLANLPVLDALVEGLIERGMLTPPEDGIGAEGCWMGVEK
ncbi:MAG: RNA polymerase sigma factor [Clostridia bacterium]|nr:RNA polymerase sigma factor [Clostridia bacterium]